jgi:hypothetical protein
MDYIMDNLSVREQNTVALKTLKKAERDLRLAQCNAHGPTLADVTVTEAAKELLFTASMDLLSTHVLQ